MMNVNTRKKKNDKRIYKKMCDECGEVIKNLEDMSWVMGRKRSRRSFWVLFLSIIGTALLVFSKAISNFIPLPQIVYIILGVLSLISAIIVGLTS